MRLLIDRPGIERMLYMRSAFQQGERHYFAARDVLAIVVVRVQSEKITGNDALSFLTGKVVDANVGWDRGDVGFVLKPNVGRRHSKATLYKVLKGEAYDLTLSGFLAKAPVAERRGHSHGGVCGRTANEE